MDLLERTVEKAKKDQENGLETHTILDHILSISKGNNSLLTPEETRQNLFLFFFAGHETTASTLTSIVYFLSKHPECQLKLQKELDSVLNGKEVTPESLEHLKYLDGVIKEALRLRPPAVGGVPRCTTTETDFEGNLIPPNVHIYVNIPAMSRDPKLWDEADKFMPERWEQSIPAEQYIPFLFGPRICIGKKFAMLEMQTVVSTLYQKFDTFLLPNYELVNDPHAVTTKFKDGLPCYVKKRNISAN